MIVTTEASEVAASKAKARRKGTAAPSPASQGEGAVPDPKARELLLALQRGLPLVQRPFARIGSELGLTEAVVMSRVEQLIREGKVRRLGAIFEPARLGYRSTLCAVAAGKGRLAELVPLLTARTSVTHCHLRQRRAEGAGRADPAPRGRTFPNLWFTVTTPAGRLDEELACIRQLVAPAELLILPSTAQYKIGVTLSRGAPGQHPGCTTQADITEAHRLGPPGPVPPLSKAERDVVRRLEADLPVVGEPFHQVAEEIGYHGHDLLALLHRWQAAGVLRRVAVILHHQRMGLLGNGLCAWRVPPEKMATAGAFLAGRPEVSYCQAREASPSFPYNLYATIHAPDPAAVGDLFGRLSERAGLPDGLVLVVTAEYKQSGPRYFGEIAVESRPAPLVVAVRREGPLAEKPLIRQVVGPAPDRHSIEDLCIAYLSTALPEPGHRRVMVIGAGRIGSTLVPRLVERGYPCEWCYDADEPELADANRLRVRLSPFTELCDCLPYADAVICAAGSADPVLTREHAAYFRRDRRVAVLDLASPGNVAPDILEEGRNLTVVNLDDLRQWVRQEAGDGGRGQDLNTRAGQEQTGLSEEPVHGFRRGHAGQPDGPDAKHPLAA